MGEMRPLSFLETEGMYAKRELRRRLQFDEREAAWR
jgi:hypothetical protein